MLALSILAVVSSLLGTEPAASPKVDAPATPTPPAAAPTSIAEPAEGQSVRVSGDKDLVVETLPDGSFRFGNCLIDTPLPKGYPMPTPPGVIEIKRYPLVRRAEVTGTSSPDLGSNIAFFPLFNHIKSRDIAMTSPVEMNYEGVNENPPEGGDVVPSKWTMSFLYRMPEQGPLGQDTERKNVKVVDVEPITVISLGVKGAYGFQKMRKEWKKLEVWLSEQKDWDAAGAPRTLYYNGPDRRNADKWAEVQIPIKRVAPKIELSPAATEPSTTTPKSAAPTPASTPTSATP